jgi:hypothetical protein
MERRERISSAVTHLSRIFFGAACDLLSEVAWRSGNSFANQNLRVSRFATPRLAATAALRTGQPTRTKPGL